MNNNRFEFKNAQGKTPFKISEGYWDNNQLHRLAMSLNIPLQGMKASQRPDLGRLFLGYGALAAQAILRADLRCSRIAWCSSDDASPPLRIEWTEPQGAQNTRDTHGME